MAGALKLVYTQWCARHQFHLSRQKTSDHELGSVVEQHRPVPFGISALKSGIKVEGIWITGPTSPSASWSSSQASPSRMSGDYIVDHSQQAALAPNSLGEQHSAPDEIGMSNRKSLEELARGRRTVRQRGDYIPYLINSTHPQKMLQELDAVYRTPRWYREESVSSSSEDVSPTRPATPPKSPKRYAAKAHCGTDRPRQKSVDFSVIDRNRKAQAAEVGQFTSRTPRHLSVDVIAMKSRSQSPHTLPRSSTMPAISTARKHQARVKELPDVVPFAQFVQSTPPSPTYTFDTKERRDTVDTLESDDRSDTVSPVTPATSNKTSLEVSEPSMDFETGPFELEDTSRRRPSFEKITPRNDKVLRGHNTGFEILKPGSLGEPVHLAEVARQQLGPPISLHHWSRDREQTRGRKLQKKRRDSVDSCASVRSSSQSTRSSRLSFRGLFSGSRDNLQL